MSELLPEKWLTTTINEVTINTVQRQPQQDESFVYIDIGSIDRENKFIATPEKMLGQDAPSRARKVVQTGDVLVSTTRPNLNAVAMVSEKFNDQIASTGFDVLRAPDIEPRWLFYIVRTTNFVQSMSELVQGALYPAIRSKDIRSFEIPLAPLNEQKRIADKLDRLLAKVDACRERCDRIPLILKRFRQSVLAAATSGELTEDWREANKFIAQDWLNIALGDLIIDGPKNGIYKPVSAYGSGTRILRIDSFYDGEVVSWEVLKRLNVTLHEQKDYGLNVGDIVVNRVNSIEYLGKSALVRDLPEPCVFESNMMRIRVNESKILPEYCIYFLVSLNGLKQLRSNAKHAVNQASINQTDVKSVEVQVPSISEQNEIIRRVEKLFAFADRLESRYQTARAKCDQLTPALLEKAFQGELVPQDPNDEPASVLLERIKSLRSNAETNQTKPQRRKTASEKTYRSEVKMLKRKEIQPSHLSDILKASGSLTAEALWTASQLEIDDFYDQLKDEETQNLLKETRAENSDAFRLLEAA